MNIVWLSHFLHSGSYGIDCSLKTGWSGVRFQVPEARSQKPEEREQVPEVKNQVSAVSYQQSGFSFPDPFLPPSTSRLSTYASRLLSVIKHSCGVRPDNLRQNM
jgi:hypothetical protein